MWFSLLRGTVLCSSIMATVTSAKSCSSTSSSCCQVSPSALVQEKASRNKRKFRADPPLSDMSKPLSMPQIDCASYEFSAEKFETMMGQGHAFTCGSCNHKDYPDGLKLDLELSSAAVASEVGPSRNKEEVEADEFQDADWNDLTENQLRELVLSNLDTIFKSAIKKITACGYSEEVATNAVLRSGLCYGCKDVVSNIVDYTLPYLRNGVDIDPGRDQYFTDLKQLETYVLAELVFVLREVRPFFSTGDAMWCLLICDMNVSHACAMDADALNGFGGDGGLTASSSISIESHLRSDVKSSELTLSNPGNAVPAAPCAHNYQSNEPTMGVHQNLSQPEGPPVQNISGESLSSSLVTVNKSSDFAAASLAPALEEKFVSKKAHSGGKRDSALRQKSLHLEKHYRTYGSKGSSRAAKLGGLGGLMYDKKLKSMSDSTSKSGSLKTNKAAAINAAQGNGHGSLSNSSESPSPAVFNLENVSTTPEVSRTKIPLNLPVVGGPSVVSALANPPPFSVSNPDLSLSLTTKSDTVPVSTSSNAERSDFNFAGIPYDRTSGQWVPRDKKEELILKLGPKLHDLQNQLQEWTEWANQKVMQAARRLSKDKAELKALKQEKEEVERLKKEKQALEENTMKKLSEMENALCKASGQVERANSAVRRLEVENAALRKEMETAKLRAVESAASFQEVSKREKKTLMKVQSWEKQKTMLQEELVTEKHRFGQLIQDVDQAKDLHNLREARWKQEDEAKEDSLVQVVSLRKEREQIEASAKSKEQLTKSEAENTSQKYDEDIQRLEKEISQLRLKADSSKIAALWRGIDGSYASRLTDPGKGSHELSQDPLPPEVMDFQEYLGFGVQRERECVMCLSEEMSVVFLPCAHQVVCSMCNELHERQGMKDCPSCRSPIQQRISVRFPPPRS
ncbi:putative E3 ubiquitin-protein ligase RF298 isoform X1 [Rhodamnia argentea]|uniref:E3 ubiquitin-protein ligase RF298 isoform X1 n=2 Tax=Rhodamnia argentea TaxID=178133 RepID=A0A8B8N0M2_9MYRT|nr:putative E3 ubiquitin-protein ligase RF298 isoform X1 [Rhodamnia argentea]